jgi:hypothetical protein
MILPLFGRPDLPRIPITRRILDTMGKAQRQPMRPKDLAEALEPILEQARKEMEPFALIGTLQMILKIETDAIYSVITTPPNPDSPEVKL